jgi:hypothetical protein
MPSYTAAAGCTKVSNIIINHVLEEFTDCFTHPKPPQGCTLYLPPFVVQNWTILRLSCSAISAVN